jgi:hypothetical protein
MTSISDFAHIGNPDAPVGSPEWCLAAHMNLRTHKKNHNAEVSSLKYGLREFKQDKRWRHLTDRNGRKFRYWEDYVQHPEPYGLGMPVEEAEAVIEAHDDKRLLRDVLSARYRAADEEDRKNLRGPGRPKAETLYTEKNDVQGFPSGNSAEAFLRRLRKDRPDIHARVLAGDLTANAGMIEAGFRKPGKSHRQTILDKILKLIPQLTNSERVELIEHLAGPSV